MQLHTLSDDVTLIGTHVPTFPMGIGEAFDELFAAYGKRNYYGVSWMDENERVKYYAMAERLSPEEEKGREVIKIAGGDYRSELVEGWQSKTDSIKDVFHGLLSGACPDPNNPCIEWYISDDQMLCMVKN